MKKAVEAEKKKVKKENKAQKKIKKKNQVINIRRLAMNNSQKVVKALTKILSDLLTGLEASNNAILDLSRPETSNNAVSDLFEPDSSSSTPKSLLGNNAKLSNNQKKTTQ